MEIVKFLGSTTVFVVLIIIALGVIFFVKPPRKSRRSR